MLSRGIKLFQKALGNFRSYFRMPRQASKPENKQRHAVVALIVSEDGKVLLSKRAASRVRHPGVWELPGGEVKPGESQHAALRREILEELGVEILISRLVNESEVKIANLQECWFTQTFECSILSGRIKNNEPLKCDDVAFFSLSELPFALLEFAKADLNAFQKLVEIRSEV